MTRTARRLTVGIRMREACQILRHAERHDVVISKLYLAEAVGPHRSRLFGYRIVDRAIAAGLIHAQPLNRAGEPCSAYSDGLYRYACTLTPLGEQVAEGTR